MAQLEDANMQPRVKYLGGDMPTDAVDVDTFVFKSAFGKDAIEDVTELRPVRTWSSRGRAPLSIVVAASGSVFSKEHSFSRT